ncbi:MAG: CoB--CoM heterodisulfide reductase iron-sulfur subunit [Candidatus Thermoplasmatota archaeon]|nr:CoB--CoM heterodisulfide reductase iron-sulfur subunit [Candidatus Thermoplasmatota archaeon]
MTNEVLIIGGGPAGLTAAKSLADRGANVVLVERSESLGGMARELTCKGLVECRSCGACFAVDRASEILKEPSVEVLLMSEVISVRKGDAGYEAKVKVSPRYVTDDCIGCGKCVEACPVEGKAISPPKGTGQPRIHWIDKRKCLHFKKGECAKCADVCPTKAIDFEDRATNVTRKAASIVYATGIEPIGACEVSRLGCGVLEDVVSSVDAERILNEKGRLVRPSDGAAPKKVAVIQCVGSRSVKNGVDYCSKFCCKYATKISQLIMDVDPEVNLDFYFMDLRTLHEPQDEFKRWAKDKKTVRLIRSMPSVIQPGKDGKLVVKVATETDTEAQENEYDLVLLSVGMRPQGVSTDLAGSLGIKVDERGFAKASADLEAQGIHVVGAVSEPMDIEEAAVRAASAATRVKLTKEVAR